MKRKLALPVIFILLFSPSIIFGAQKIMTDYNKTKNYPKNLNTISFDQHMSGFTYTPSTAGAVSVSTTNKTANLGNSVADSCGVLWYGGTNPLVANCTNGSCDFGIGFRAYFEFRFLTTDTSANSTTLGDGFTFTVMNATNNDDTRRGGPGTGSMGELMCYAGSGNTADEYGLRSPKMAIEFDTYGNTGAMASNGCSSGRADPNNLNHMALMFWGDNKTGNCGAGCTTCLQASYDDNVHGICTSGCTNPGPTNSTAGDGTNGYCQRTGGKVTVSGTTYNWMEDGQTHLVRVEVTRAATAVGGTYAYNIKAWLDCEATNCDPTSGQDCTKCCEANCNSSCTPYELNLFKNIFEVYYDSANPRPWNSPPKIDRTIQLSAADHANLNKIIFGFTEGTGGAVQNILISNLRIYFPGSLPSPVCTLTASPNIVPYNGATALNWTIANGPANGTWTVSPGGTCSNFTNSSGGSCTTAAQTTPGANTYTLTIANANGNSTCSANVYVGCSGYTVYNNTGSRRDFRVSGSACRRVNNGSAIPDLVNPGETVTRYNTNNTTCGTAQGSATYTDAMNVDIVVNGGNGNCQVNYNAGETLSDR